MRITDISKKADLTSKLDITIPLNIFRNTPLTIFEALVSYLKDTKCIRYREIAMLLGRDERNIWTVYSRANKKKENKTAA